MSAHQTSTWSDYLSAVMDVLKRSITDNELTLIRRNFKADVPAGTTVNLLRGTPKIGELL